jgi:hypothetical protein
VGQDGIPGLEREPEVLAPASGRREDLPLEPGDEIVRPGEVAPYRPGVQDLDGVDRPPGGEIRESAANDLYLWELRHLG